VKIQAEVLRVVTPCSVASCMLSQSRRPWPKNWWGFIWAVQMWCNWKV